ncbi:MAG: PIN domain-containing protein [Acidobacteria bacterium]|nr:MAG: PIN domain-containing protein [Acidobacteriota bacterium]
MNGSPPFVDTNVLVYAHDRSAGPKQELAKKLLDDLWRAGGGSISVQVLQEFYVAVTRKVPHPLGSDDAEAIVRDLAAWQVFVPGADDVLAAIRLHRRLHVSFWDALILHSAAALGCDEVWSEDLNAGEVFDGVTVRNPFAPTPPS